MIPVGCIGVGTLDFFHVLVASTGSFLGLVALAVVVWGLRRLAGDHAGAAGTLGLMVQVGKFVLPSVSRNIAQGLRCSEPYDGK